MPSGKFLFTLVGLLVAVLALCKMDFSNQSTVEGYWGGMNLGKRALPVAKIDGKTTAIGGTFFKPKMAGGSSSVYGHSDFVQTPGFQSILSPRFGNVDYGANIRYNAPDHKNTGVPCHPLDFGDMAKENYSNCGSSCSAASCGKGGLDNSGNKVAGGYALPSGPGVLSADTGSNYNQMYTNLRNSSSEPNITSELPVGTMTTMDASGRMSQPVVFDRLMYAPRPKSRLAALGDMVRGDLAITPCQSGWFSVYPTINTDLQEGYLGVAGGANAANQDLVNLIIQSSGGSQKTVSGLDMAAPVNMTPETSQTISALTDVMTTSMP